MCKKCFMCDHERCSDEHVPAQCFFPKGSENRIYVDSCAEHNELTGNDDQYVRDALVMVCFSNASAEKQFQKTLRGFQRRPAYMMKFLEEVLNIATENFETKALKIERERLDRVMMKYAYALYYHEFGAHWNRKLAVLTDKLYEKNIDTHSLEFDEFGVMVQEMKSIGWPPPPEVEFIGANPDTFQYLFVDITGDKALIMIFYNIFDVWVIPYGASHIPELS